MECPSCRTPHPDEAEFCTLCYAPLRARGEGGGAASRAPAFAAFPSVETLTEGFLMEGPLVMRGDGLWFFVRSLKRTGRGSFGNVAGFQLGGLYVRLVRLVLSRMGEAMGLGAEKRPAKLEFRSARRLAEEFDVATAQAPLIPACADCFAVEKGELEELTLSAWRSTLTLKTRWTRLEVAGVDPREKAAAFLKGQGYPLKA